jgi:dolichol-phosphate mannosyltransferase
LIATLDGDGQNPPADIAALVRAYREGAAHGGPLLVTGWRRERNDGWLRRFSSRLANRLRGQLLGDACPDTGCGLKVFTRDEFLALPRFRHMHRFLPALFVRAGGRVLSVPVAHRPRRSGRSKYGVRNRLWVGLVDLAGVYWLQRRGCNIDYEAQDV